MRTLALMVAGLAVASCTTSPLPPDLRAQERYQQWIAGKVAGPPMTCLPTWRSNDMTVVDSNTLVFRNGDQVYVNHPLGGCSNLRDGYTLVTRRSGGVGMCRGDIAEVVDLTTGMTVGSCAIGDFIPYSTP